MKSRFWISKFFRFTRWKKYGYKLITCIFEIYRQAIHTINKNQSRFFLASQQLVNNIKNSYNIEIDAKTFQRAKKILAKEFGIIFERNMQFKDKHKLASVGSNYKFLYWQFSIKNHNLTYSHFWNFVINDLNKNTEWKKDKQNNKRNLFKRIKSIGQYLKNIFNVIAKWHKNRIAKLPIDQQNKYWKKYNQNNKRNINNFIESNEFKEIFNDDRINNNYSINENIINEFKEIDDEKRVAIFKFEL